MAKKILFPVLCECSGCGRKFEISELRNFYTCIGIVGLSYHCRAAYAVCSACGIKAYPVDLSLMETLYMMIEDAEEGQTEVKVPGIRIIKDVPLKKPFRLTCDNGRCHTTFEVSILGAVKTEGVSERYCVACPACGKHITVYNEQVIRDLAGEFLSHWHSEGY